jgi:DNA modification methylase
MVAEARRDTPRRSPPNLLNDLSGREWLPETKSVWFQKGLGASHPHAQIERQHPAPYSYQDVARLISFFTKKGGRVLDPFVGVGSTLKACALTKRVGTGIELLPVWADLAKKRLDTEVGPQMCRNQTLLVGDARKLLRDRRRFKRNSFDFVVCSPPYWGILNRPADHKVRNERINNGLATRYSDEPDDLANICDYDEFLLAVWDVFAECWELLRPGAYAAIVVGDFRNRDRYVPYHADLARLMTDRPSKAFELKGITILVQNQKRLYPYGYPFAYVPNMHHQYVLILRKPTGAARARSTHTHRLA